MCSAYSNKMQRLHISNPLYLPCYLAGHHQTSDHPAPTLVCPGAHLLPAWPPLPWHWHRWSWVVNTVTNVIIDKILIYCLLPHLLEQVLSLKMRNILRILAVDTQNHISRYKLTFTGRSNKYLQKSC